MSRFENVFQQKNYDIARFVLRHDDDMEHINEVKDKFKASFHLYKDEVAATIKRVEDKFVKKGIDPAESKNYLKLVGDAKELTAEHMIEAIDTAVEDHRKESKNKKKKDVNKSWR